MRARMALNEGSFPIKGLQRSGNGQILTKWEKCEGVMVASKTIKTIKTTKTYQNTQGSSIEYVAA